jgi:hypothetical protein
MNNFDVVIVGGGLIGAYVVSRLEHLKLRVAVIDKTNFEEHTGVFFEAKYYGQVDGYMNKQVGGMSHFWGGQIQQVDSEKLRKVLGDVGQVFSDSEIANAYNNILDFLGLDLSKYIQSASAQGFTRVLNRWLGKRRFFGTTILRDNKKISVLLGKVISIDVQEQCNGYRVKYVDFKQNAQVLTSNRVVFTTGVIGLAEYILGLQRDKVLHYRDHYSISLGISAARSELGRSIRPLFIGGQIVTPRIYFQKKIDADSFSLYASMPLQRELSILRNKLSKGLIPALTFVLFNAKVVQLIAFIFGLIVARFTQSFLPVVGRKVKVNAFVDSSLVAPLTISKSGNDIHISKLSDKDFDCFRDSIHLTVSELGLDIERSSNQESYFDCGYHAYSLSDETGRSASHVLTDIGIQVLGASELRNIGDRNPVFLSLLHSELHLNRLFHYEKT